MREPGLVCDDLTAARVVLDTLTAMARWTRWASARTQVVPFAAGTSRGTFRPKRTRRVGATPATGTAILVVSATLAACSGTSRSSAGTAARHPAPHATTVGISVNPGGCAPQPSGITAGKTKFDVANQNATGVSKAVLEAANSSQVLGETETRAGMSTSFTRTLAAGSYKIVCAGALRTSWVLRVTSPNAAQTWQGNPDLVAAVDGYAVWVKQRVVALAARTATFVAAVKAGQIGQAKLLYPKARIEYESIEPVAEVFGDLDIDIDGRIDNFPNPAEF